MLCLREARLTFRLELSRMKIRPLIICFALFSIAFNVRAESRLLSVDRERVVTQPKETKAQKAQRKKQKAAAAKAAYERAAEKGKALIAMPEEKAIRTLAGM